jgi:hypothetical protein
MCVDASHLGCGVSTHAQRSPRKLVHQLESTQILPATGAAQERLEMLDQRRHDQLKAVLTRQIQQLTAHFLKAASLCWKDVSEVLGQ